MNYSYGYIDLAVYIEHLVETLEKEEGQLNNFNFLFVCIDSFRTTNWCNVLMRYKHFMSKLSLSDLKSEGFWIPGSQIKIALYETDLIVPFSAAYLFPKEIKNCDKPTYDKTSEMDQFKIDVPTNLIAEITRLKAVGYIADGIGFNYLFTKDILNVILSTSSWLKEEINKTKHEII